MTFTEPDRLKTLPPYLFMDIDRKRRAALAAGKDIIDFGIGDPDRPTPAFIIAALEQAVRNPAYHRYPTNTGMIEFRRQAAVFIQQRYGVSLDPENELLTLIGSKEGLGHLPLAVVNPGQTVLIPEPGYPVYRAATLFAGGVPWTMRLSESNNWLPDFKAIPAEVAQAAVLMYLNYPNNPTAAVASLDFFEQAVAFARDNNLIIAQDAAYNEVQLTTEKPVSILQVPGAKEVTVEFHSCSKSFNMTGWRLAFVAGNTRVIAALARIKDNLDSGAFAALQVAGGAALAGYQRPEIEQVRALYRERAEILCAGLQSVGFRVRPPKATFYVWAGVPEGYDAMRIADKLLDEAGLVCIPGIGFGQAGEGYVRFALTVDADRIRSAVKRLQALTW